MRAIALSKELTKAEEWVKDLNTNEVQKSQIEVLDALDHKISALLKERRERRAKLMSQVRPMDCREVYKVRDSLKKLVDARAGKNNLDFMDDEESHPKRITELSSHFHKFSTAELKSYLRAVSKFLFIHRQMTLDIPEVNVLSMQY